MLGYFKPNWLVKITKSWESAVKPHSWVTRVGYFNPTSLNEQPVKQATSTALKKVNVHAH